MEKNGEFSKFNKIFLVLIVIVAICFGWFYKGDNFPRGTTYLVFGDSGTGGKEQIKLAAKMLGADFSYIIHTGDIAYPAGTADQFARNFTGIYGEHLARAEFYPSPGNHDYMTENLSPYLKLFDPPHMASGVRDQGRYYSVELDKVHLVSLDTNKLLDEVSLSRQDDMLDWLEQDLASVSEEKWKIVFFHHPPYTSGKEHGEDLRVQSIIVPILERYGVDLVFSGHEHNYERTCPISRGECETRGVTYVITGGGGAKLYDFGDTKSYSVLRSVSHHFVLFSASDCVLNLFAVNIKGRVIDNFALNRCQ